MSSWFFKILGLAVCDVVIESRLVNKSDKIHLFEIVDPISPLFDPVF
jgi:hypothetical protein